MRREDTAYWTATAASVTALALLGPLGRRLELMGEDDLSRIWAGPRAIVTGHDPYDPTSWVTTAVALGTQRPDTAVYIYPPWVAVPLTPLGFVPLPLLVWLWLIGSLAAVLIATRYALDRLVPGRPRDHALVAVTALLSWTAVLALVIGQWGDLLVAALFAGVLALRRERPLVAGLAALTFLIKPQLFVFTAPAYALHAVWPRGRQTAARVAGLRAVAIAVGGGVALVVLGWLFLPSWWPTWLQTVGVQQTRPFSNTLPALFATLLGPAGIPVAALALAALALVALSFHPASEAWMAVWTALSLAGAPYANSYDHILLIVPIVLAAGVLHTRDPMASRRVLWVGCSVLLIVTPLMYGLALARHSESVGVVVPLLVFAIVTGSLWRYRRGPASLAP